MKDLLARLVAVPTVNPGGDERRLADLLHDELRRRDPDDSGVETVGDKAFVWARYGDPKLGVNVHLDTVPVNAGWTGDPFALREEGERLYGLGAADTKGAIAAVLTALAEERPADTLILFSGDEELTGTCVRAFLPRIGRLERMIVCEPTSCRAGTRHRGIVTLEAHLRGEGGHSSRADIQPAPLAELARMAVAWHAWGAARRDEGPEGFRGMCFNVAKLDGGVAFNVIPDAGMLTVSFRPPPGADARALVDELTALAARTVPGGDIQVRLFNAPFATRDLAAFRPYLGAAVDAPVDLGFWTEAAIWSAAGVDAVVFGPGDIGRAHAPDEWVPAGDLASAAATFAAAFRRTRGAG
ncbi:MAG TPA: M20/M25/M40 family metallo-hydrolase [Haliangiales bacterium]|nr:M20/M25/M40 family metallo-hydrolase [Haliangiales bacterium]